MMENTNSLPFLRTQALLETFLVFHCHVQSFTENFVLLWHNVTFFQAIIQGRIYALRYELCDDMEKSPDITDRDPRRTMWDFLSPIALFASAKVGRQNELVPVAIQMNYQPG